MKRLLHLILLISSFTLLDNFANAQCDINTGCGGTPSLTVDPPTFDAATLGITFNNIEVGEFECIVPMGQTYQSGVAFYIYQLLPNGNRMDLCNVINAAPFNVVGSIALSFGETSFCTGSTVNLGLVNVGPDEGFVACDGAFLEIEAALYITDNTGFDPATESVFTGLTSNEFITVNLGTLDININNEFPGGGQPLTSANITELATGADGPIAANCGEDVEIYVEGLSRLANCPDYTDITTGIASELSNEFYYTVNGGTPIIIQNSASGAAGGQLTGPDANLGGNCYAGILGPYTLEWADLPPDLCDGSTVVVTITTTDVFTGQTLTDDITINYTGAACTICNIPGCTDNTACNFDPLATDDDNSCLPVPTCNTDICMGDIEIVDPNDACVCIVDVLQVLGCTDATACNFDATANCDDNSCLPVPTCNTDICMGDIEIVDPNDACVCIVDVLQVLGCTDATACNFDATANCDDNSCLPVPTCNTDICMGDIEIVDPNDACVCIVDVLQVLGCTDATACNFDATANCDDTSCLFNDCEGNCGGAATAGTACTDANGNQSTYAADCSCPATAILGCIDNTACNFDATANQDDGSCLFNDCEGNCGGAAIAGTACTDANGGQSIYAADCSCNVCEEEITGVVAGTEDDCDLGGITLSVITPDAMMINVVTAADGTFIVPGGPFQCGTYTIAFFDLTEVPFCYSETGSTEPISFVVDGIEDGTVDVSFLANPNIPTLSQWGLIVLALLLTSFGAISLLQLKRKESLL